MRGLILSGGAGTRLRPITHTSAKQLVPIANKPILFYGIEDMAEAGITEIGIVVGDTRDEIMAAVGDGSQFGVHVTYLPQDAPRGLAHCVLIAADFLGDEDFVMYLGDNMLEAGLAGFVQNFEAERAEAGRLPLGGVGSDRAAVARILLKEVDNPKAFGVAEVGADGEVVHLVEKPEVPPSNLALVGVYLFDRHIHEAVRAIAPSPRGELEITDAIQWLIDEGHAVIASEHRGWWLDTGKKDPLLEANRVLLELLEQRIDGSVDEESRIEGRVVIETGAIIERSTVRGPVAIGAGARVSDSFIGPFTAIGPGCEVVDTEIDHSVVLEGSRLLGAGRVVDSLLGREVVVTRHERRGATRLTLGDHSSVDLG